MFAILELRLGTFLAESPAGELKGTFWIWVIKHLHLLAVDPEGAQAASNL